jgi:hypothetical protein
MDLEDELNDGKHILMEMKLVEYANDNGLAKQNTWKLTDNAKKVLLSELNDKGMRKGLACLFSGGQIKNITRKIEVDAILSGKELLTDNLTHYCREEIFNGFNANKKIGFGM